MNSRGLVRAGLLVITNSSAVTKVMFDRWKSCHFTLHQHLKRVSVVAQPMLHWRALHVCVAAMHICPALSSHAASFFSPNGGGEEDEVDFLDDDEEPSALSPSGLYPTIHRPQPASDGVGGGWALPLEVRVAAAKRLLDCMFDDLEDDEIIE
eukprot:scaffold619745_cov17-Prasinocladus_malaysianus.AAC.1